MPKVPIELDLYNSDNEKVKSLSRVVVPWGILKKAVRLGKKIFDVAPEDVSEENLDEMADLVVEIFGEEKVTRQELDKGADVGDMISVIETIVNRGHGLVPNAPPAAK
jgi:hypothetical protein